MTSLRTTSTYCANDYNSTPFTRCCGAASFGRTCVRCDATITHHEDSPAVLAAKRLRSHGRCGMCGKPKGVLGSPGVCYC